jgi:hypothetical protein
MKQTQRITLAGTAGLTLFLALPAAAQTGAAPSDAWAWRASINAWLPSVHSTTQFDLPSGGNISANTDPGGYLSKLKFAFMGTLEARRGPWSLLADGVYVDFGNLRSNVRSISGPGGIVTVPIDAGTTSDLKGFVGTFEGGYAVLQTSGARADVVAGLRYANLKTKLDWQLSGPTGGLATSGGVEASKDFVDGVVGVRGNASLGGNWDVRYYLDGGAGTSRFTWQAFAGIGYRYSWGDVVLGYRHLAYDFHSDKPISDLKLSGPLLSLGFTF